MMFPEAVSYAGWPSRYLR